MRSSRELTCIDSAESFKGGVTVVIQLQQSRRKSATCQKVRLLTGLLFAHSSLILAHYLITDYWFTVAQIMHSPSRASRLQKSSCTLTLSRSALVQTKHIGCRAGAPSSPQCHICSFTKIPKNHFDTFLVTL